LRPYSGSDMKSLRSLFLVFVTLLSLFVSITGLVAKIDLAARILQVLFLPVTAYLIYVLVDHFSNKTPVFDQKTGFRRAVIYYCFIVTATVVSLSFFSSLNVSQFVSSLIFSPMAFYFFLLVWPRRKVVLLLSKSGMPVDNTESKSLLAPVAKVDVDRRNFLKLIGSAGILAVILGLFSRRSGVPSFLGNVDSLESVTIKNTSGNVINPAEHSPTEGYNISQIDDSVPSYFGFVNKDGGWFIMREGEDEAFLYAKGDSNFTKNWSNRVKLTYNYFDGVF